MQKLTFNGRLGRDPELKTVGNSQVCNFSVASKQRKGDTTNWIRCAVWGKRGESVHKYLAKGMTVYAAGELSIGEYDGKPQFEVEIDGLEWFGGTSSAGASSSGAKPAQQAPDDLDDFVPF